MAENMEQDPVVVEDPVVDVDDNGPAVAASKGSKMVIVAVCSVVISILIYVFVFGGGNDEDTVDNGSIVIDEDARNATNIARLGIEDNVDTLVGDMGQSNDFIAGIESTVPNLPNLPTDTNTTAVGLMPNEYMPQLPDDINETIANEINEKKQAKEKIENTYTKEEVDKIIADKLKEMQDNMERQRSETEQLQKELKAREEEERKNQEKSERRLIPNLLPPGTGGESEGGNSNLPPTMGGVSAPPNTPGALSQEAQERQKKEEEEARQVQQAQRAAAMQERRMSPIFKMQGGGGGSSKDNEEQDTIVIIDKDLLSNVQDTESTVTPTKVPDLSRVVLQGKIINAVLESSINTDVQAQVRAVVTRDVYAEYGKNILIPKGSRLIGTFQANTQSGVARVSIVWNRIIRVDGLSINISASATDTLGRGGIPGDLDNKYLNVLKNSFLSSLMTIATAVVVDKVTNTTGINNTTNTITGEAVQTAGTPADYAIIEATQNFMDDAQEIVDNLKEERPTIRVPQGTKVIVLVNQDLTLPLYKKVN